MRARFLLMGYALAVLPAFAMPITHVEPGLANDGPLILVHDHWINNRGYKDENGTHCCDHRANNGDCDEVPAESVKPTPDGQGYLTPKGRISNRSTYISEDGKTYLCGSTKPRCLFVPGGG